MSVVPTSAAQVAAWRSRTVPAPEQVRPGLWVIAVPVPTPITYTLCYVLEAPEGILVIDPGWPDDTARQGLADGLAAIGRSADEVATIVVSHLHPDHVGLSPWLLDQSPTAVLRMQADDLDRILPAGQARRAESDARWSNFMGTVGAPAELGIDTRAVITPALSDEHAPRAQAVAENEVLTHGTWELEVIVTPGHTRGSIVLLDRGTGLLFTGDHVLPTVTPAVTQQNDPDHDILGDFLASLRKVRDLPVTEVLPGHQYRFHGLADRVDAMCSHHDDRLHELTTAVTAQPGTSCYQLTQQLRWSNSDFDALSHRDRAMAARETLAHLTHLRLAGRVTAHDSAAATSWHGDERTTNR